MDNGSVVFSDMTINEGFGDYVAVGCLMDKDVGGRDWMLSTNATVSCNDVTMNYLLHFWKNGQVYIMKTDRPISLNVPDDDLRYLSKWCVSHGWGQMIADKNLLRDPIGFDFWLRMYQAGIAYSEELEKRDSDEMKRLSQVYTAEAEEEDAN